MSTNSCESEESMRRDVIFGIVPRTSISRNKKIITQPVSDFFKALETYFRNQELTDVILVAGNRRIPAHRLVLGAASKYFAELFKDSTTNSPQHEFNFVEVDGDVLFALIEYCYTGSIELQEENLEKLLEVAVLLQLSTVVEACCQFLSEELDVGNCFALRKLADTHGCTELSSAAHAYALKNFMDVMKNQQFLCLSAEDLAKLLESDDIIVPSEETVFHALMKWIQHDSEHRSDDAGQLLSCVKLPLLSPAFIAEHIENNELFRSQRTAQDLIIEALMFQLLPERKPALVQSGRARPRKSTLDVLVLLAVGEESVDAFYPGENAWKNVASTSDKRKWFCSALVEDKLLVVGGKIADATTNTVKSFEFSSLSWNTLSPMNTPRYLLGAAVLNGFLYVVGGRNGSNDLNTVEKWDPVSQQWSYVAAMSTRRRGVSVAVLNNKLYAAGGKDGNTYLKTMECYDPNTDKWTPRAPMSKLCSQTSMGVVNGYLYVLGGWNGERLDSVERYDPKTNTWCMVAPMSVKRASSGVSALGNRLFAVGGLSSPPHSDVVEAYDPDLNEWQQLSPLEKKGERSCVVVNNFVLRNSSF